MQDDDIAQRTVEFEWSEAHDSLCEVSPVSEFCGCELRGLLRPRNGSWIYEGYALRHYDGWSICATPDPLAHGVDPFSPDGDSAQYEGRGGAHLSGRREVSDIYAIPPLTDAEAFGWVREGRYHRIEGWCTDGSDWAGSRECGCLEFFLGVLDGLPGHHGQPFPPGGFALAVEKASQNPQGIRNAWWSKNLWDVVKPD